MSAVFSEPLRADRGPDPMAPRVLLADDHRVLREGLRRLLESVGCIVVGEAGDGEEAVRLVGELAPDAVLMDVSMPGLDGIAATRAIRRAHPEVAVVVLTMHAEEELLRCATAAGAAGYLVKDCSGDDIVEALDAALRGRLRDHRPGGAAGSEERLDVATVQAAWGITRREVEVLQLLAEGASTAQVAERLYISAKTVKNHLASIYEKLDVANRTQAVLQAARLGLVRIR
jgi:DNA-binding NarL/FixJ family response regulator